MSRDAPHSDRPTPAEQAAAEALAEAIDGGPGDAVDVAALEAAGFLAAHRDHDFALSDDRFAAVRHRLGAELDARPRRRWRWLLVAAPALAAGVLALVVMPSLFMSAHEPAPAPASMADIAPASPPAPTPAIMRASAELLRLQARVIEGDADADAAYRAALAAHRTQRLAAMGGRR